jgi:hypothetical protein
VFLSQELLMLLHHPAPKSRTRGVAGDVDTGVEKTAVAVTTPGAARQGKGGLMKSRHESIP